MGRGKINCCKGCTEETGRQLNCHSTCERYRQEKAELEISKSETVAKSSNLARELLTDGCIKYMRRCEWK